MRTLIPFLVIFSTLCYSQPRVIASWCGAVTSSSAVVKAKLSEESMSVKLMLGVDRKFTFPFYSANSFAGKSTYHMCELIATNLTPLTKYYYVILINNKPVSDTCSFTTFSSTPYSYKFVAGSCAGSSHHKVFESILDEDPLFYINTGDIHYSDSNSEEVEGHGDPLESVMQGKTTGPLFKSVPFAYIWDDHDYCGNNSDGKSVGRDAAIKTYDLYIPHYPLMDKDGPVAQAFDVGRVKYIITDLRSERTNSSLMSSAQTQWFKDQVLSARNSKMMVCWISSVSYSGTWQDNWGGYRKERAELADFFRSSQVSNMFIISGDAHMIAIDDGTNTDYSTASGHSRYKYPVLQAAALNRGGSDKGGIYSHGKFPNPDSNHGQYGVVEVADDGDNEICITLTGKRLVPGAKSPEVLTSFTFCRKLNEEMFLQIFPNPARDKFSLIFRNADAEGSALLKFYDYNGNLKFSKNLQIHFGDNEFTIEAGNILAPGVYLVNFDYRQHSYSSKLVIAP